MVEVEELFLTKLGHVLWIAVEVTGKNHRRRRIPVEIDDGPRLRQSLRFSAVEVDAAEDELLAARQPDAGVESGAWFGAVR